jgi:hypothetical protein
MPVAAVLMISASLVTDPPSDVAAQAAATPKPTAKPAGGATAPRAGGIPLELAGGLVAGGSAVAAGGLYALRRRRKSA